MIVQEQSIPPRRYALSLSGGGVRSMLFCLGALRAVVEVVEKANARPDASIPATPDRITDIASVSGGSIATAYTFSRLDPADPTLTTAQFDAEVLKPAYDMLISRSMMWSSWPFKLVVAIVVVLLAGAAGMLVTRHLVVVFGVPAAIVLLLIWRTYVYFTKGFGWRREVLYGFAISLLAGAVVTMSALIAREYNLLLWHRMIAVGGLLLLFVFTVRFRGWALEQGMIKTILKPDAPNRGPKLRDVKSQAKLAITATDLTLGQAIYLTPGGIISGHGTADPGDFSLIRAARASATFPGVFPALFLPHLEFCRRGVLNENVPRQIALVDGGLYDNMGTEWLITHTDCEAQLVVVNASSNLAQKFTGFGSFGLGELSVLSRNQSIQYDASTAPRRRWLFAMFLMARLTRKVNRNSRKGMIVKIDGALDGWLKSFARPRAADPSMPDEIGPRAKDILKRINTENPLNTCWGVLAKANSRVGTSLDRVPKDDAQRLIRLGYLTTSVQLHVLEGTAEPVNVTLATLLSHVFSSTEGTTDVGV
jgi:predicted acylesterase/phospholipase RssA